MKLFRCSRCGVDQGTYHDESDDFDPSGIRALAFLNKEGWRRSDGGQADNTGEPLYCPWCARKHLPATPPCSALPAFVYVLRARCGHAVHSVVEPPADDLTARRELVGDLVALTVTGDVQSGGWIERDAISAVRCGPHVSSDGCESVDAWLARERAACGMWCAR